jgi:4-diphosphocytidyl-2-C-methyl-D-erythritol kinase
VSAGLPAHLTAPAKLTLQLRVVGIRSDGYHLIEAEMVSLDLSDVIELGEGAGTRYVGPHAPVGGAIDDDLVGRALAMVGRTASATVTKNIPSGAGLGGGSSDAAAVLRWAGSDDLDAAARLGADVPFCVVGGRALVRGIGEQVEPLDHEDRTFTLLTPEVHCSTPAVYRRWDDLGGPTGENANDLMAAALSVAPELELARRELWEATGVEPRLAGSGSTWFVEGSFAGPGRVVTRTVDRD